jgi:hypothetical protein
MFNELVYQLGKQIRQRGTTIQGKLTDLGCPDAYHQFYLTVSHDGIDEKVCVWLDGDTYEVTPFDFDIDLSIDSSART